MTEFDLDSMLADILDESKPLPTAPETPATITPEPAEPRPAESVAMVVDEEEATAVASLATDEGDPEGPTDEELSAEDDAIDAETTAIYEAAATPETPFSDTKDRTDYALPSLELPTFTTDEIAQTIDLRNFATLVTLNTKRWHGKVKDRKASQDIANANNADAAAFETRKRLLAGADTELKKIHKEIDEARAEYYTLTMPWTTVGMNESARRTGPRAMPNTSFFDFVSKMGQRQRNVDAALDVFEPLYPALIEQARKQLGDRFDISEYPNAESIRSHFGLSFDFHPIPEGKDFSGLPAAQCQALADALQAKTKTMLENAMQDLWVRIHENVGRMAERLSHPDKLFHYTLVDNVRSLVNQMKHLNVTNDARVEELRQYIEKHLCQHDVDTLRKTPTLRAETGAHAQSVLDKMAKFAKGA
jgi:hypothetical protein